MGPPPLAALGRRLGCITEVPGNVLILFGPGEAVCSRQLAALHSDLALSAALQLPF